MDNEGQKIIESPIGQLLIAASDQGITILHFILEGESFDELTTPSKTQEKHLNQLELELKEFFDRKRTSFDVKLDIKGTDFQKSVWEALLNVPYGATRTYKQQSIAIGNLKAIRAVGTANGQNPIAIVVPCHRVIGSDGSLTGFGGGIWRKKFLLELESQQTQLF